MKQVWHSTVGLPERVSTRPLEKHQPSHVAALATACSVMSTALSEALVMQAKLLLQRSAPKRPPPRRSRRTAQQPMQRPSASSPPPPAGTAPSPEEDPVGGGGIKRARDPSIDGSNDSTALTQC